MEMKTDSLVLLSGNEAIARGAYEYGVLVATAYPGTPSSEILESIVSYEGIDCQWSPNEKVALEVAAGSSLAGVRSLVAMKHVGLNVAADPLLTLSYTGVRGGLLIITADDPGMHSSQNEQDNRHYASLAKLPLLEPSDSQEALEMVGYGLSLSEDFKTPVLLRTTTRISHTKTLVKRGEKREFSRPESFQRDPKGLVMVPAYARLRHPLVEERMKRLAALAETTELNRILGDNQELGIITSGISFMHAKEAIPEAMFLKLGLTYPLPIKKIREMAEKTLNLLVIEELDPFLEEQIKALGYKVSGKNLFPRCGELTPGIIRDKIKGKKKTKDISDLPPRIPSLCPGCPHRGLFYALKRLKVVVTGDIGCYSLAVAPPLEAMDTLVCMGAGIGMGLGIELALKEKVKGKVVAVIGDSTFAHSGLTGLMHIVYNKGRITIIILDNSSTAMTGQQENPFTGKTLKGEETVKLNLVELVKGLGVKNIKVIDPYQLKKTLGSIKEELERDEVSVIISKSPCTLIKESVKGKPYTSHRDLCKSCGRCLQLGCPAISKDKEGVIISPHLCFGCGLCQEVCPFQAIKEVKEDG